MKHLLLYPVYLLFSLTVHGEVLFQSQNSWDGGEIYYPEGQAEVTVFKLVIKEGETPRYHCHPIPTFGYVVKGNLEVETKTGQRTVLKEGDYAIEVMKTMHRGKALNGDVEVLVFYAGAVGMPTTILDDDPAGDEYCK